MALLLVILIVITCAVLAFFVLIQNPKGGGLAGTFGGFGNQMMGAKQSTDVVEKGTWAAAAALLILTLGSFILTPKNSSNANEKTRSEKVNKGVQAPAAPAPQPPATSTPPAEGTQAPTSTTVPAGSAAPTQPQPAPTK